jgi:hypothetical protein
MSKITDEHTAELLISHKNFLKNLQEEETNFFNFKTNLKM